MHLDFHKGIDRRATAFCVKGLIFDIDGTLIQENAPLPGAVEIIARLKQADYQCRFISNTTGRSATEISKRLQYLGFDIAIEEIQTSVTACLAYLQAHFTGKPGYLAMPEKTKQMLEVISQTDQAPAFVVLGDLAEDFTYARLNQIFHYLLEGAQLICFHKNPFYLRAGQKWLDSGAFTHGLEQASGTQAIMTGKPGPYLFEAALTAMNLPKDQVIIIGDDILTDIQGAHDLGMRSYLVGSGKYHPDHLHTPQMAYAGFLPRISDLWQVLDQPVLPLP